MYHRYFLLSILFASLCFSLFSQSDSSVYVLHEIVHHEHRNFELIVESPALFSERWHELTEVQFWTKIMLLPPDSSVVYKPGTREVLAVISTREWRRMSRWNRYLTLSSIRWDKEVVGTLFVAEGRGDYYEVEKVIPQFRQAFKVFQEQGVDPWYAQAILMIESPGKLLRSPVGAYGPFQLMPNIGRYYGLKVGRSFDERADIERSAYAAARLIKESCIPEARVLMARHRIPFDEDELWCKLMALHVYHAGAKNVGAALQKIRPRRGGIDLMRKMWNVETGDFQSASQNYSQLALAAQLALEQVVCADYQPLCEKADYDYLQLLTIK